MFNERICGRLSSLVYLNASEISLGTCLRSGYFGLSEGHSIAKVEMFNQVDVLKSVGA